MTHAEDIKIWIGVVATLLMLPFLARPFIVRYLMLRLRRLANSFWVRAGVEGKREMHSTIELHELMLSLAITAPLFGSGTVKVGKIPESNDAKFKDFLSANGWALGYVNALALCFFLLCALGRPYSWNRPQLGLLSFLFLGAFSQPDGSVRAGEVPEISAHRVVFVEEINDQVERRECGRLAPA